MTGIEIDASGRRFPQFVLDWRAKFKPNGEQFTPVDYLNQQQGILFALATQWLFSPSFVEYRGCVILSEGMDNEDEQQIDKWLQKFAGDVPKTESTSNLLILHDVFALCDLEPYEEDLSVLAQSIAECWRGLLKLRFPDREFVVEVFDDWEEPYDPQITFYSKPPEGSTLFPTRSGVVVHTPPPGLPATVDGEPVSIHVDLPPSLRDEFAQLSPISATVSEIDVRNIADAATLATAIAPDATTMAEAVTRTTANALVLTGFEQLWVKNRSVAEQLLNELPAALTTARAEGETRHVALADLASPTAEAVLELLRAATTGPEQEHLPVFHYPLTT